MIWILATGLAVAVSLYLVVPFLVKDVGLPTSDEVDTYRTELKALDQSEEPDAAKKAIIQARLIKAAKANAPFTDSPSRWLSAGLSVLICGASLLIYAVIGSPNFTPETRQPVPEAAKTSEPDFVTLLPRFEAILTENSKDVRAWTLYGRTLMLAGDSEAGLRAYERAIELSDDADIRKEYEAAQTFAATSKSGPNAEDIAAMQNLSETERQAAIEGMVESLRARLASDPTDVQGWIRLLRSRKVLGQIEAGEIDIATLREVLPKQADVIIMQSGWNE